MLMKDIQIYHDMPENLEGYIEMPGLAIDAYQFQRETGLLGVGDFSSKARQLAVETVAHHFNISKRKALKRFEICIVPGISFHGKILAKNFRGEVLNNDKAI